jgi:hypothetical protein
MTHRDDYKAKIDSEGSLFLVGHREAKLTPRAAAVLRKLGQYVDSADVLGKDDGLLAPDDADYLRGSGVLVLDEEIAHEPKVALQVKGKANARKRK